MDSVFVTNHNNFTHEDKYDGKGFVFPPKELVVVPVEAAVHMLGFGLADKTDTLSRLGWANLPNDEGVKMLAKFVFSEAQLVQRVIEQPESAAA